MNSILLYFSRDGSTKITAEFLAAKLGCDLYPLEELNPKRGFIRSGFRSASGKRPPLKGDPWSLIKDRDVVVLGAPIWAGNGNPILNSFLDKADLSGKKIYLFTLQADPKLASSIKVLEFLSDRIKEKGGEIGGVKGFHGEAPGKTADKLYLETQADSWEIQL